MRNAQDVDARCVCVKTWHWLIAWQAASLSSPFQSIYWAITQTYRKSISERLHIVNQVSIYSTSHVRTWHYLRIRMYIYIYTIYTLYIYNICYIYIHSFMCQSIYRSIYLFIHPSWLFVLSHRLSTYSCPWQFVIYHLCSSCLCFVISSCLSINHLKLQLSLYYLCVRV